jgi:CBS domain-containing protein
MARYFLLKFDHDGPMQIEGEYKTEEEASEARKSNLFFLDYEFFILKFERGHVRRIEPSDDRFDKVQRRNLVSLIENWLFQESEVFVTANMTAECLLPFARRLISALPDTSMTEIKKIMVDQDVGSVALVKKNECFGIVKRKDIFSFSQKSQPQQKAKLQDVLTPIEKIKIAETNTDLSQVVEDIHKFSIVLLRDNAELKWALSPKSIASAFEKITKVYIALFCMENAIKRLIFSLNLGREKIKDFMENNNPNFYLRGDDFIYDKLDQGEMTYLLKEYYEKIEKLRPYNKEHLLGELNKARNFRNDLMHFRNLVQLPQMLRHIESVNKKIGG